MNNINWSFYKSEYLNIDEYNALIEDLNNRGITRISTNGKRVITGVDILRNHYFISDATVFGSAKNQVMLYIADSERGYKKYCVPMLNSECTKLLRGNNYGYYGYRFINDKFREHFGITFETACSGKQYKDTFWKIKNCVCSPINFVTTNSSLKNIVLKNCFKSDESSSYPAKLLGKLPTLHGHKIEPGRVEPTKEFPFAFYVNSGHLKIWNELDSREFNNRFYPSYNDPKSSWRHDDDIKEEDDETILCRELNYNMKPVIQEIYDGRKEHPEYKMYMNMCIGFFHTTQPTLGPICSHIASVVLSRCVKQMIERAERISEEGNIVLLINTDAIAWIGKQSNISEKIKNIGAFIPEYENGKIVICGVKKYQICNEDESNLKTVCSGLPLETSENMKFGDIVNCDIEEGYYALDKQGKLHKKYKKI